MTEVNIDILIEADPQDVFLYISDFENNPKWQKGMQSAKITSEGDLQVGTTYDQVARFMMREIITSFEVIDYIPGKMVKARSTSGSFPITFTRSVEEENGKARVKALITGDSSGFFKVLDPIMTFFVKRSINKDYNRLKEIFESSKL